MVYPGIIVTTAGMSPGPNPGTNRCPACWSAVAPEDDRCAECGQILRASKTRWLLPIVAAALVAIGGASWWGFLRNHTQDKPHPEASPRQPDNDQPKGAGAIDDIATGTQAKAADTVKDGLPPRRPRTPRTSHVLWIKGNERPVALVRVATAAASGPALFCVPIELLPLRGPLTTSDGDEIDAAVVTVDWQRRLVLLQVPASAVADGIALPVGTAASLTTTDRLEVWDPRWETQREIGLAAPLGGAIEMKLDDALPVGALLLFRGHAVAYGVGGTRALPLGPLLPWLRRAISTHETMTLAELQRQVRSRDPQMILEDAAMLLARRPVTMKQIEEAMTMLEQGQRLARDATSMQAFTDLLARVHRQRIRLQSHTDRVQALVLAKQALLRFPDHPGILADTVLLTLDHGDPAEALALYEQLLRASREHARSVADDLSNGLQRAARSRRRAGRNQEALVLLTRAVQLFPQRADLHLAHAQALAAADRDYDALAAANEAARLDPSYARYVDRYQRAARDSGQSRTHVIPFDPRTRVLKTKASVGGQPVRFLVDTGASLTTIPTALADRLGLRRQTNPRTKVTTASGELEVEVVELPSLRLGRRIRLSKVRAAVLDLPGENLAGTGLLGLNALRRLNMEIDSENSRLILKQRRKPR